MLDAFVFYQFFILYNKRESCEFGRFLQIDQTALPQVWKNTYAMMMRAPFCYFSWEGTRFYVVVLELKGGGGRKFFKIDFYCSF